MESISNELSTLEDTYKAAFKSTNDYKKQLDSELHGQKPTRWELEHQTKRETDYKSNIAKITKDMAELKYRLPKIGMTCLSCFFSFFLIWDGSSLLFVDISCHYRDGVPTLSARVDFVQLSVLLFPFW